jgi:hypothetical protein
VVYITHLTREDIKMSKKKYTPFHSQNENYTHTCTFNLTTYISSLCLLTPLRSIKILLDNFILPMISYPSVYPTYVSPYLLNT